MAQKRVRKKDLAEVLGITENSVYRLRKVDEMPRLTPERLNGICMVKKTFASLRYDLRKLKPLSVCRIHKSEDTMSVMTIQCRLVAEKDSLCQLWELMADNNTPLIDDK